MPSVVTVTGPVQVPFTFTTESGGTDATTRCRMLPREHSTTMPPSAWAATDVLTTSSVKSPLA
jgi:hypothetical protein